MRISTREGVGSGTLITADGYILTNWHVIAGFSVVDVVVQDSYALRGQVVGYDDRLDLAVVKIGGGPWPYLETSNHRPNVGDDIIVLGYALGLPGRSSVTKGVVSQFRPGDGITWIQTDTAINPGNSGGAAVDAEGQFVGVPTFKFTDGENVSFLAGIFSVSDSISELMKGAKFQTSTPTPTRTPTPTPGIRRFGPTSGYLEHNADGYIKTFSSDLEVTDFIAEATFYNPYPTTFGNWDYGFLFRKCGTNNFFVVTVTSDGWWYHYVRNGTSESTLLSRGKLTSINTQPNGNNEISVAADQEKGVLYINDNLVASLNLSQLVCDGDVSAMTGYFNGNEIPGQSTPFFDFVVLY